MDVFERLAPDPHVQGYFAVLGYAMFRTFWGAAPGWPRPFAFLSILVTWFLIFRFIIEYKRQGGNEIFDEAYIDVLVGKNFSVSSQLLTWVAVAILWAHEAPVHIMIFGMLGAMSAAFACWAPQPNKAIPKSGRWIPVTHAVCSLVALYSIAMLQHYISIVGEPAGRTAFSRWLLALHVMLVLPTAVGALWPKQPTLDGRWVYFLLGTLVAVGHGMDPSGRPAPPWSEPWTDCQLSITTDMLMCAVLTIHFVYSATGGSLVATSVAVLATPLLTPGSILALFLAYHHSSGLHWEVCTYWQRRLAGAEEAGALPWMNLGLRDSSAAQGKGKGGSTSGAEACRALATRLASRILEAGDGVLVCGCGFGAELALYQKLYPLAHITGVDPNPEAARGFEQTRTQRLLCMSAADIAARFPKGLFSKVLALDSVYHFPSKEAFFGDAAAILRAGGKVAVTDVVLVQGESPWWLRAALQAMNIPACNLWSESGYADRLRALGFRDVVLEPLEGVLEPWFPQALTAHLRYVAVTATVQAPPQHREKVAVIGSGLAGLMAAHELSGERDVTVFEASGRLGLEGQAAKVCGAVVDMPLRLSNRGYYKTVARITEKLGVARVPTVVDSCCYGTSAPFSAAVCHFSSSPLRNVLAAIPHWRDVWTLAQRAFGEKPERQARGRTETWGEWLDRNGYGSECKQEGSESACMWVVMGQFSWFLSCTYEQLRGYPAQVILDFLDANDMDPRKMTADATCSLFRVFPTVKALAEALAYGSEVRLGAPVGPIGADRVVDGVKFDHVVVATEARAVPKILPDVLDAEAVRLFDSVRYNPSSIVIHADPALMPARRADWRLFNIKQDKDQDMCQLTVWMNLFYPEAAFDRDVFQTWNPFERPREVLKDAHFMRVVHTRDTAASLQRLARLQGQLGFYFAGAYSVFGMGLLEQAAQSGEIAAACVRRDAAAAAASSGGLA